MVLSYLIVETQNELSDFEKVCGIPQVSILRLIVICFNIQMTYTFYTNVMIINKWKNN